MATSYTSLLGLALPVTGELSGTWGDTVNNAITSLLDTAVAGTTTVSADTTLTTTSGAANQARSAIILASGHVANITITAPAQSKIYTVINASGTYTVTFRGVGPTTGTTLGANEKALLAWNGSDFVRIGGSGGAGVFSSITNSSLTSGRVVYSTTGGLETDSANLTFNGTTLTANTLNLTNALGTTYGGTGLTSFTSGGVVYASSTSALTTGSALTFDGTTFGVTNSSASVALSAIKSADGNTALFRRIGGTYNPGMYISLSDTVNNEIIFNTTYSSGNAPAYVWQNASSEQMRLTSTGLGIGTSSPTQKLHVVGDGNFTRATATDTFIQASNSVATFNITQSANGSTYLYNYGAYNLYFGTNSATRMTLDSSGNLGIGTSSPSYKLDVQTSAGRFQVQNYGAGSVLLYSNGAFAYNAGTTRHEWQIAGSTLMTLDSSGNLGLGVTPSAWGSGWRALQVNGFAAWSDSSLRFYLSNNAYFDGTNRKYIATGYASEYQQPSSGGFLWNIAASGTAGNSISFTQAMTLDASGNLIVGGTSALGTTSGRGNITVNGTSSILSFGISGSLSGYVLHDGTDLWINNALAGAQRFYTNGSERARIDSSGNLIVGGTSTALGLVSVQGTGNYNAISAETSSSTAADTSTFVFRKTGTPSGTNTSTTGNIVFSDKYNNGTQADTAKIFTTNLTGSVVPNDSTATIRLETYSSAIGSTAVSSFRIGGSNGSALFVWRGYDGAADAETARLSSTAFLAGVDNTQTLGGSSRRWTTVYATTGTINTSDRNDKQDIKELSAAEQRVAARVKGLIRKFRFKDSVAAKGDNARIHFGVIAQDVQAAFTAEGLDASRYGLFCSDTFKAIDGKAVEKDENGQYPEGAVDYTRLGVRYEELLAFVISAI